MSSKQTISKSHLKNRKRNHIIPSQTLQNFDKFMRKRNEKQIILHSNSDSLTHKINSFDQLLRLTKAGNIITISHDSHQPAFDKAMTKKFKTCKLISDQNNQNQKVEGDSNGQQANAKQQNQFDDGVADSIQQCFQSQNRIKSGNNRMNPVFTQQQSGIAKTHKTTHHYTSSKLTRVNSPVLRQSTRTVQDKIVKGHYLPMKKRTVERCVKKMNRKILRSQNTTLQAPFRIKQHNNDLFSNLKRNIDQLQEKAKLRYGIQFKDFRQDSVSSKMHQKPSSDQTNGDFKENNWIFNSKKQAKGYRKLVKTNFDRQDSSIPHCLLSALPPFHHKQLSSKTKFIGNNYIRI